MPFDSPNWAKPVISCTKQKVEVGGNVGRFRRASLQIVTKRTVENGFVQLNLNQLNGSFKKVNRDGESGRERPNSTAILKLKANPGKFRETWIIFWDVAGDIHENFLVRS